MSPPGPTIPGSINLNSAFINNLKTPESKRTIVKLSGDLSDYNGNPNNPLIMGINNTVTFQFTNPTDGAGTYVLLVQADNLNTRSFYNLSTVLENENTNGPFITGDNQIVRAPVGSDIELFVLFNLQVPSPFTTGDVLNINVKIEN